MRLFIDTWGWLALRDRLEARHHDVRAYYEDFRSTRGAFYTTDYVLDETFTLLFRRLPFDAASESMAIVLSFTDLTTMVVMQEREIAQILTEDEHFTHVGLGLQIAP